MPKPPKDYQLSVFINCPFDQTYQRLFYAIVFAVQIAGLKPRCALEASNAGTFRLQKIKNIIAECKFGIHDISRTESSSHGLPRFNMPLELGIDLGCKEFGNQAQRGKSFLVMDRTEHRYERFISDIKGQDIQGHHGDISTAINHVRNWLSAESHIADMPGGDHMYRRFKTFQKALPVRCKNAKLNMKKLTFGDFTRIIRIWLEENEI